MDSKRLERDLEGFEIVPAVLEEFVNANFIEN